MTSANEVKKLEPLSHLHHQQQKMKQRGKDSIPYSLFLPIHITYPSLLRQHRHLIPAHPLSNLQPPLSDTAYSLLTPYPSPAQCIPLLLRRHRHTFTNSLIRKLARDIQARARSRRDDIRGRTAAIAGGVEFDCNGIKLRISQHPTSNIRHRNQQPMQHQT